MTLTEQLSQAKKDLSAKALEELQSRIVNFEAEPNSVTLVNAGNRVKHVKALLEALIDLRVILEDQGF